MYCARFCVHRVILTWGSGTQSVQAIDTNKKEVRLDSCLERKLVL